jgi:hypothetical protein
MAIEPFVTPQIWAMVNLQLWTGCRPGEACVILGPGLKRAVVSGGGMAGAAVAS